MLTASLGTRLIRQKLVLNFGIVCQKITENSAIISLAIWNVLCYFGHLFPVLKLKLIKTFCYSLYGSVLCELDHSNLETLCTTWRKGLRHIWDLPYRTHSNILPLLCSCLPIYSTIASIIDIGTVCGLANTSWQRAILSIILPGVEISGQYSLSYWPLTSLPVGILVFSVWFA